MGANANTTSGGRISASDAVAPRRKAPKATKAGSAGKSSKGKAAGKPKAAKRSSKGARVIAFANQKGGVAKTTTTLNLAVAFKESGHRVLCVDMDPQGNLTISQGVDP